MFGGFVVFGGFGVFGVTVKRLRVKVKGLRDWG